MRHLSHWFVHVYRPNHWKLKVVEVRAVLAEEAITRAKALIYKEGRLAHFYSYVPILKESNGNR